MLATSAIWVAVLRPGSQRRETEATSNSEARAGTGRETSTRDRITRQPSQVDSGSSRRWIADCLVCAEDRVRLDHSAHCPPTRCEVTRGAVPNAPVRGKGHRAESRRSRRRKCQVNGNDLRDRTRYDEKIPSHDHVGISDPEPVLEVTLTGFAGVVRRARCSVVEVGDRSEVPVQAFLPRTAVVGRRQENGVGILRSSPHA